MASRNAFTEEGRTRFRNFERRIKTYFMLWIVIGLGVTIGCIYLKTRYGYRPLQRLSAPVRQSLHKVIFATQEAFPVHPTGSGR
jgi:hypothetical protein